MNVRFWMLAVMAASISALSMGCVASEGDEEGAGEGEPSGAEELDEDGSEAEEDKTNEDAAPAGDPMAEHVCRPIPCDWPDTEPSVSQGPSP